MRRSILAASGLLVLLLGGCRIPVQNAPAPTLEVPANWRAQVGPGAPVEQQWWRAFGDPALDALVARALAFTGHPVMAQIIPMRFCNLSCAYCNEYDKVSEPVPIEEMNRRIDHLGRLGTSIITISGGEPLTHPDLDLVIRRIRRTGALDNL